MLLVWKRKRVRIALLVIPAVVAFPFLLPGKEIHIDELRTVYLNRLKTYEGTNYFWGGESSRGIDCSGLPRKALRDALLTIGFKHLNGKAFRSCIEHWWFDASALALSKGYRHYTEATGIKGVIRQMNDSDLMPGDLAVTMDGIHLLVYADDGKWIQADPGVGSVITLDGRQDSNLWFSMPVTIHRWKLLTEKAAP